MEMVSPKYMVPLKSGHHLHSYVVNPLFDKSDEESENIIFLYKDFMLGNNIDIWMKRQHTIDFLYHCKILNKAGKQAETMLWPKEVTTPNQGLVPDAANDAAPHIP